MNRSKTQLGIFVKGPGNDFDAQTLAGFESPEFTYYRQAPQSWHIF